MTKSKINILLIEDEEFDVRRIKNTVAPLAGKIQIQNVVSSGVAAMDLIKAKPKYYDVIIMDFQIAGGINGERLIRAIKEIDDTIQIIVVTKMTINITDFDFANQLLEAGAVWYCTKYPGDIEEYIYQPTDFILSIYNAYDRRKLEIEKQKTGRKLKQQISDILESKPIIGKTQPIEKVREQIIRSSQNDSTVLINGLSGTGKELVAFHIHYNSKRKYEKFLPVNCGSLPADLIESELFGFEKGSFTGAAAQKPGLFEIADKGTIFLDEIGELPLKAQVKLLRVIQEGEIDKIGRTGSIKVNVRIIAATNKNLQEEIKNKRFREDLYYRLNVFTINVPPLQERREDIIELCGFFMNRYSNEMGIGVPELTNSAKGFLKDFKWPGNVRQMQNVVQRLLWLDKKRIEDSDIASAIGIQQSDTEKNILNIPESNGSQISSWREIEKKVKSEYFNYIRSISDSDAEAARKLGLAPPNFYRMCKELGIK